MAFARCAVLGMSIWVSVVLLAACSSATDSTNGRQVAGGGGSSNVSGATGGMIANDKGGSGGSATGLGNTGNTDAVVNNSCGKDTYMAEGRPLTIYTLFDDSGSMVPWWPFVTQAFIQFVKDPASAGINVGIKFFGNECSADFYSMPDIPIDILPDNATPIENNLGVHFPISGTATTPALQGGLTGAQQRSAMFPEEKVVILLVTDGLPSECDSTLDNASAAAKACYDAGYPVYVLGLGDINGLNMLAQAGGTGDALSADPSMVDLIVAAMNEIRGRALPCDYSIPAGGENMVGYINLVYDDGAGGSGTIPNVPDAGSCDPSKGGWYFNDAGDRIIACDQTCTAFKDGGDGFEVSVVLGCPTETLY